MNFYNRLIAAVPAHWHRLLGRAPKRVADVGIGIDDPRSTGGTLTISSFTTSKLYNILLQKHVQDTNPKVKAWQKLFNNTTLQTKHMFPNIYSNIRERYISDFQYKFVHMVLPTNKYLTNIMIKDNPKCDMCTAESESVVHALYYCPHAVDFWKQSEDIFINLTGSKAKLYDTCFGFSHKHKEITQNVMDISNFLIFLGKYCIWRARQLKHEDRNVNAFIIFRNFLRSRVETDHFHAKENNQTYKNMFISNWCCNNVIATVDGDFNLAVLV